MALSGQELEKRRPRPGFVAEQELKQEWVKRRKRHPRRGTASEEGPEHGRRRQRPPDGPALEKGAERRQQRETDEVNESMVNQSAGSCSPENMEVQRVTR